MGTWGAYGRERKPEVIENAMFPSAIQAQLMSQHEASGRTACEPDSEAIQQDGNQLHLSVMIIHIVILAVVMLKITKNLSLQLDWHAKLAAPVSLKTQLNN